MKLVLSPATRSVLPTATDILTVDVTEWQQLTVEVKNLDGSQTMAVEIWRRCSPDGDYSLSPFDPFGTLAPGASQCADMDVSGSTHVQLRATASGIGCDCRTAGVLVR